MFEDDGSRTVPRPADTRGPRAPGSGAACAPAAREPHASRAPLVTAVRATVLERTLAGLLGAFPGRTAGDGLVAKHADYVRIGGRGDVPVRTRGLRHPLSPRS